MKSIDFDPRMTFDSFVVGPANRLASAASRRAADSPGTSFNPLFLYSASGLGKSHILSAIAQHAQRNHAARRVVYQTLEGYLEELTKALEEGNQEAVRDQYRDLDILLLDDVQFLTGQKQAQEMLLRTLDALTAYGAQIVLASDRAPADIDALDARLLSRFSGGLIVDIGQPDYETRVAILRRKAEERGAELSPGVAEAMSRSTFRNVRELQGSLNRLLAVQELEGRPITVDDLPRVMGEDGGAGSGEQGESGGGMPSFSMDFELPGEPEWIIALRESAEAAELDGFDARRLRVLLDESDTPEGWEAELARFQADIHRAAAIRKELEELGNGGSDASEGVLKDPDRLEEAESLLAAARELARPFPPLGEGPELGGLGDEVAPLAVRAADRLVLGGHPDYNPLYLHTRSPERGEVLLKAAGRAFLQAHPGKTVAHISVSDFSEDFIRAISDGVSSAWRERWLTVDVLLLHGVEALSGTERAQDEFFHLFEALKRRGSRILLTADRPPSGIEGVDERLRSRFEGGLVIDLDAGMNAGGSRGEGSGSARGEAEAQGSRPSTAPTAEGWFPPREKVVWNWPRIEERIAHEEI